MTNLDSILKSRDITLPTKVHLVKAMVFPVVMYGCESWTVKKAEHWSIDAFELWCWRRLLRVPWTARRSNQSILKEISPGISLEAMMLKLKLQYFGHFIQRVDLLEKTDAGRDWGQEEKGTTEDEMAGWHHMNSWSWWWTGRPGMLRFMGSQRVGHDWATDLIWSDLIYLTILDASKEESRVFVFFWLTYFTFYNVFKDHPYCHKFIGFPSILRLNNISLYGYFISSSSIHLSVDVCIVSISWLLRTILQ